jgi:HAD superfamily hydrolase (TIGR01509 family)
MPLRALLWDVDGTLAETEDEGHRVAFNLAFEEAGLPWRWDAERYAHLLGVTGGKERLLAWWRHADPDGAAAAGPAIRRLHERKTAFYLDLLRRGVIGLRPGVRELLLEAQRSGLRQAIATTTTPDNVLTLLDVTLGPEGRALFDVIGAGDVVPDKKPAPDIHHWVLGRLGLPAGACLAIEDSAPGVAAARAAGLAVLLVRSRYSGDAPIAGAAGELGSLAGTTLADLRRIHRAAAQSGPSAPASA